MTDDEIVTFVERLAFVWRRYGTAVDIGGALTGLEAEALADVFYAVGADDVGATLLNAWRESERLENDGA